MPSFRFNIPKSANSKKHCLKGLFPLFSPKISKSLLKILPVLSLGLSFPAVAADVETQSSLNSVEGYSVQEYSKIFGRDFSSQPVAARGQANSKGLATTVLPSPLGLLELSYPTQYVGKLAELNTSLPQLIERAFQDSYVLLEKQGILTSLASADYAWRIEVKDKLEFGPNQLGSSHCHTAAMAPPADIYINANRLRTSCEGNAQTLNGLLESLVHEVSHAVEYRLMGLGFSRRQRFHSEGFAMWLQSQYSLQQNRTTEAVERRRVQAVLDAKWLPYTFRGTEQDYLLSYALIQTIVGVFGSDTLYKIYSEMSSQGLSFIEANERVSGLTVANWMGLMRLYYAGGAERFGRIKTQDSLASSSFYLRPTLKAFPLLISSF